MKVKVIGGTTKNVRVETLKVGKGDIKKIVAAAKNGTLKVKTVKL